MVDYLLQQARPEYGCCLDVSETVHRAYAERHGLVYKVYRGAILPDWSGHWDALPLILSLMARPGTDRVFWLDADTLIMSDCDMRQGLPAGVDLAMCRHPGPPDHWNCGVMFLQNTPRIVDWITAILELGPGQYPHFQQEIMNDLLRDGPWGDFCARLDDRWNSTVVLNGPADCHIRAWHGFSNVPEDRARAMRETLARVKKEIEHGG